MLIKRLCWFARAVTNVATDLVWHYLGKKQTRWLSFTRVHVLQTEVTLAGGGGGLCVVCAVYTY